MTRRHAVCALRRKVRDDGGQSLIEFVLALPILLVLVFGIIEFAAAWRTYQVVTNVARDAARVGVVPTTVTSTKVTDHADTLLVRSGLSLSSRTVTATCNGGGTFSPPSCSTGNQVEVDLDYQHRFVVLGPVLNLMCSGCGTGYGTMTLRTTSIMRRE